MANMIKVTFKECVKVNVEIELNQIDLKVLRYLLNSNPNPKFKGHDNQKEMIQSIESITNIIKPLPTT